VEVLLAIVILAALAIFVAAPLVRSRGTAPVADDDPVIADLEARTGKLSDADWARADAQLRREAIEILKALDSARAARE
jgi:hypothetical protein